MKLSSNLILAAVMATAVLTACKKQDPMPSPNEPKAEASVDNSAGTTTNFETPPAEPAKPGQ